MDWKTQNHSVAAGDFLCEPDAEIFPTTSDLEGHGGVELMVSALKAYAYSSKLRHCLYRLSVLDLDSGIATEYWIVVFGSSASSVDQVRTAVAVLVMLVNSLPVRAATLLE